MFIAQKRHELIRHSHIGYRKRGYWKLGSTFWCICCPKTSTCKVSKSGPQRRCLRALLNATFTPQQRRWQACSLMRLPEPKLKSVYLVTRLSKMHNSVRWKGDVITRWYIFMTQLRLGRPVVREPGFTLPFRQVYFEKIVCTPWKKQSGKLLLATFNSSGIVQKKRTATASGNWQIWSWFETRFQAIKNGFFESVLIWKPGGFI